MIDNEEIYGKEERERKEGTTITGGSFKKFSPNIHGQEMVLLLNH